MTRWTVTSFNPHSGIAVISDEDGVNLARIHSMELAAQIVADHNQVEAMREALEQAEDALYEAHLDYNHPAFTDRRGAGPRMTKALNALKAALAGKG